MKKKLSALFYVLCLTAALAVPAAAYSYDIAAPGDPEYGMPTSVEPIFTADRGERPNMDVSKNAALIPPAFGSESMNALHTGEYSLGYDPKTGKLIRKSVYGKTQKEVRLALSKIVSEMDSGTYAEPSKMKVSQWLDEWLASYTMNIKPATRSAYEEHIRVHIKPSLGDIPLKQLSTRDIQQLYTNLLKERELSPKTVRNIHGVLHRTLEQAKLLGCIRVNPTDAAVTPRVEKKQVETLDAEDIGKFLAAIRGTKYEYPLFVAVFTGLRQGELLGLTWDCVDFENGLLLINKQHNRVKGDTEFRFASLKNDKARVLTAADEVMEVLKLQKERQTTWAATLGDGWSNPDHLVFTTEFGRYINNKILYQNFKRIMRKLGKPDLRFHDLRHTYAVNSLRAGDDIKTVQENLGHATASFTLATYAHATPGMKRESAKRMTEFIRSVQSV